MTAKEMHIGVDLLLQKINSNFIDVFEPEEIDWALNEEVLRFVKQRFSAKSNDKQKGFQDGQKRLDDLKALIEPASLFCIPRDSNSVYNYLPHDYLTLINDRTITTDLCGALYNPTKVALVKNISCIQIADDSINLYSTFKIFFNNLQVFNIVDYPTFMNPVPVSAKFALINLVIQVLEDQGYVCKYSEYYDSRCPQGIIVVTDNSIDIDVEYVSGTVSTNSVASNKERINVTTGSENPNRLCDQEDLYDLLNSSFGTTISSSPISTLEKDKIIVFHKQKFIPSTINISYLRKPRKINLSLGQDCDLDEWIQQEIIDNTAKRLAGIVESPNYRAIINENLLKE
jgi:hypothetical protein